MSKEHIYLPNTIFADLQTYITHSSQTAFAYSYIYYTTYLYRYCKYIDDNGNKVTQEAIKEFLGYSPKNKKLDHIIKKGGILDNIFYTETTTDYPVQFLYDEENLISFDTISNYKGIISNFNERNFKIKKPIRAFYRTEIDMAYKELTGTFYEVENTHRIDFSAFKHIITSYGLGVIPFYIYGYLTHKNNMFKMGYQRSAKQIGLELNMSDRTVRNYIDILEQHGLIYVERKAFNLHLDKDDYEANIYNIV